MDPPHLLKFRKFVGSSHKVGHYINKTWGNASFSISSSSERMANALAKYGFVRLENAIQFKINYAPSDDN